VQAEPRVQGACFHFSALCDQQLSGFAFNFNLRLFILVPVVFGAPIYAAGPTVTF